MTTPKSIKYKGAVYVLAAPQFSQEEVTDDLFKRLEEGVKEFIKNAKSKALWEAADSCSATTYPNIVEFMGEDVAKKIIKDVFTKLGAHGDELNKMTSMIYKGHNTSTGY